MLDQAAQTFLSKVFKVIQEITRSKTTNKISSKWARKRGEIRVADMRWTLGEAWPKQEISSIAWGDSELLPVVEVGRL